MQVRGIFGSGWVWLDDLAAGKLAPVTDRTHDGSRGSRAGSELGRVPVQSRQVQRLSGDVRCKAESQPEVENLGRARRELLLQTSSAICSSLQPADSSRTG